MTTTEESPGRAAQRRRTRRTIVEATMSLLAHGLEPSVNEIAAAADVSRRTVYMHFPTLDQLILDATLGLMNVDLDSALRTFPSDDPGKRLAFLVDQVSQNMEQALPLGRRLIKLTVGSADSPATTVPRRGQRRVGWIEWAVEPLRERIGADAFEDLVSALCTVIGWEPYIVLADVRGLPADRAQELTRRSALAILDAAVPTRGARDR